MYILTWAFHQHYIYSCVLHCVNPCGQSASIVIVIAFIVIPQACLQLRVFDENSCSRLACCYSTYSFFATSRSILGVLGRALVRIFARRTCNGARMPLARLDEPDMRPKCSKKVTNGSILFATIPFTLANKRWRYATALLSGREKRNG